MCAASVNGSASALRSGSVPAVTPSALHFFRRRPLTEASFQINSEHPARPQRDGEGGQLYGNGGKFKNTTVRGFRSFLSFPPPPKPLPLCFHRAHLSLREQTKK
jgi:hypothetical protein